MGVRVWATMGLSNIDYEGKWCRLKICSMVLFIHTHFKKKSKRTSVSRQSAVKYTFILLYAAVWCSMYSKHLVDTKHTHIYEHESSKCTNRKQCWEVVSGERHDQIEPIMKQIRFRWNVQFSILFYRYLPIVSRNCFFITSSIWFI